MKMKNFNFFDPSGWEILDRKIIHTYTEEEYPITIVKVKIGTVDIEEIKINNTYEKDTLEIIRWMLESQYTRFFNQKTAIIW